MCTGGGRDQAGLPSCELEWLFITHLDFTSVREAAVAAGLQPLGSARQESYLVHLASGLLQGLATGEDDQEFLRQFQTLTHPAFFGSRFHVLEFAKGATSSGLSFPCPA